MAIDRLEIRINPVLKASAVEAAKAQDRSLSNFVALAIKRAVAEQERAGMAPVGWSISVPS